MSSNKDPKVDTSLMSKEVERSYYLDNARARQLAKNGNEKLESGDANGAAADYKEALDMIQKYEKYQKKI